MAHLEGKRNPKGEGIDCSCFVGLRLAMGAAGLNALLKAWDREQSKQEGVG